jgi:hypothetical protein
MKIVDNFLDEKNFNKIKNVIFSTNFPWFYNESVNTSDNKHSYFTHLIYFEDSVKSQHYVDLLPLLEKIKIDTLLRVKINCYPRSTTIEEHAPHIDYNYSHKGVLFSLNTCDGYTGINNKKINSTENRALLFDPSVSHFSTNCTNAGARINININYV